MMLETSYAVLCMAVPCMLYEGVLYKRQEKRTFRQVVHLLGVGIFLAYVFCAILVAGIGSIWEIGAYGPIIRFDEINIIPFRSEGSMTYILNIIMFLPLGFFVPFLWKEYRSVKEIIKLGFFCSLSLEICQLFNRRITDIDDLMMNTLGAFLGFGIWYFLHKVLRRGNEKAVTFSKREPLLCFFLAVLGEFLFFNWRLIVK